MLLNHRLSSSISILFGMLTVGLCGIVYTLVAINEPLWLDELHTAWVTSEGWDDVADRSTVGNQNPLYFWIVWSLRTGVAALLGTGIESTANPSFLMIVLRFSSMVAGLLILLLTFSITQQFRSGVIGALVATMLIGLDSSFLFYATEARPYALMQLVGLIQVIYFARWLQSISKTNWFSSPNIETGNCDSLVPWFRHPAVGWGVASSLMLMLHLTAIWLLISEFMFLCLVVGTTLATRRISDLNSKARSSDQSKLSGTLTTQSNFPAGSLDGINLKFNSKSETLASCLGIIFVLITIAYLVFTNGELIERRGNWQTVSSVRGLWESVKWGGLAYLVLPAILVFFFTLYGRLITTPDQNNEIRTAGGEGDQRYLNILGRRFDFLSVAKLVFLSLWGVVPIAAVVLADYFQITPLALKRYTWIGAAALPIFAGFCVNLVPGVGQQSVFGFLIIAGSLFIQGSWIPALASNQLLLRNENWHVVMLEINNDQNRKDWPVFLYSNLIEDRQVNVNASGQFQEFLKFPLHDLKWMEKIERQIYVGSTSIPQPLPYQAWDAVRQSDGAWIVVRGLPNLRDQILVDLEKEGTAAMNRKIEMDSDSNLSGCISDQSIAWRFDIAEFADWPNQDVHLIRMKLNLPTYP